MENFLQSVSPSLRRAMEQSQQKGSSSWLNVIPLKEMGFDPNKTEFRDALHLRYCWSIPDKPAVCVSRDNFDTDHAMICKKGGFITMRPNELRSLEAELLNTICKDVQIQPVLQDITGEILLPGAHKLADARLDTHARGLLETCSSAFFDARVCHFNAETYTHHSPKQIYKMHEREKKRQYAARILEIEKGTLTPLIFSTTGGMGEECLRYHRRLVELLAMKKGDYPKDMNWIGLKISFSLILSALVCLRGSTDQFVESLTTLWTLTLIFRQLRVVLEGSELNNGHEFEPAVWKFFCCLTLSSRWFLGMTKKRILRINKLPEVSSNGQVRWCLMALGSIWKAFQLAFWC